MGDTTRLPDMPKESGETLTASDGPHAPRRDKRPERNYPAIERETGVNRRDPGAPGGPVNIPVKGGAPGKDSQEPPGGPPAT